MDKQMKKKILLDLDGVMIKLKSWKPLEILSDGFPNFERVSVDSLNKILTETQSSIILTSSHKNSHSNWNDIFKLRGIDANIEILKSESSNRKVEIMDWYYFNNESVDNFVIIDDDKSLNDLPKELKFHLVSTSSMIGLNLEDADLAIKILNNK